MLNFSQPLTASILNHHLIFCNYTFIILSCLFPVSNKAEAAEVDPLLESQSDGGTLLGSSQISAPEDYWFFANRVIMWCGRSKDNRLVAWQTRIVNSVLVCKVTHLEHLQVVGLPICKFVVCTDSSSITKENFLCCLNLAPFVQRMDNIKLSIKEITL